VSNADGQTRLRANVVVAETFNGHYATMSAEYGFEFGSPTGQSSLIPNEAVVPGSIIKLPATSGTLALEGGSAPTLDDVLTAGDTATDQDIHLINTDEGSEADYSGYGVYGEWEGGNAEYTPWYAQISQSDPGQGVYMAPNLFQMTADGVPSVQHGEQAPLPNPLGGGDRIGLFNTPTDPAGFFIQTPDGMVVLNAAPLTGSRVLQLPDADGVLALEGAAPTLDEVLEAGDQTDGQIRMENGSSKTTIRAGFVHTEDVTTGLYAELTYDGDLPLLSLLNRMGVTTELKPNPAASGWTRLTLPSTSGTLALEGGGGADLDAVLTAGNTSDQSILLDNTADGGEYSAQFSPSRVLVQDIYGSSMSINAGALNVTGSGGAGSINGLSVTVNQGNARASLNVGSGEPDIFLMGSNGNSVQIVQNPAAAQGISLLLPATGGTLALEGGSGGAPTLDDVLAAGDQTDGQIRFQSGDKKLTVRASLFDLGDYTSGLFLQMMVDGTGPLISMMNQMGVTTDIRPNPLASGWTQISMPQASGTLATTALMDEAITAALAAVPTLEQLDTAKEELRQYVRDQIQTLKDDIIRELREVDL
jgi:hypothetical protein